MTDTERAWMDYFVAYEDYAKNKESREDWLFLAKTLYKPYKEFRCKDVIKKIWKLRNKFNTCYL